MNTDEIPSEDVREVNAVNSSLSYVDPQENDRLHRRKVYWLDSSSLRKPDHFSATWLQPVSLFMKLNPQNILTVEDACHEAYRSQKHKVRMSLDWLDFSVEHMSKWWKLALATSEGENSVAIDRITGNFLEYINSTPLEQTIFSLQNHNNMLLHPTIAIISFQPIGHVDHDVTTIRERSRKLTITALGATLSSLARLGFGRIVVVGGSIGDKALADETFKLLPPSPPHFNIEYGFVQVQNETWYKTKFVPVNQPRAAVVGLQLALRGELSQEETQLWLGTSHETIYWEFVYLTEPDTILLTRPSSLHAIHDELTEGMLLMPHRLQPVLHETDIAGTTLQNYIRSIGKLARDVIELDQWVDACCDEGPLARPGPEDFPSCGHLWYVCGFIDSGHNNFLNVTFHDNQFKRFIPYDLVRFRQGTKIVSLAASEHGRMCRPTPNHVCHPKS